MSAAIPCMVRKHLHCEQMPGEGASVVLVVSWNPMAKSQG